MKVQVSFSCSDFFETLKPDLKIPSYTQLRRDKSIQGNTLPYCLVLTHPQLKSLKIYIYNCQEGQRNLLILILIFILWMH